MNQMSARTIAALQDAVEDQTVVDRYWSFVSTTVTERGCRLWTGAVSSKGHGRLWLASYPVEVDGRTVVRDVAVIAHRFGYALANGAGALLRAEQITHRCDEPLCQEQDHVRVGTNSSNQTEFWSRRWVPESPLRDTRGARGRSVALRDAARSGGDLKAADRAGRPLSDLLQDRLPL
jgi:hypothetical protein